MHGYCCHSGVRDQEYVSKNYGESFEEQGIQIVVLQVMQQPASPTTILVLLYDLMHGRNIHMLDKLIADLLVVDD